MAHLKDNMQTLIQSKRTQGMAHYKVELNRLIDNADSLILKLKEELAQHIKKEEYYKANEKAAAIAVHEVYVYRLQRLEQGMTAFETDDMIIYEEQENKQGIT